MLQVVAASVRGPAHLVAELPCQDAWASVVDERGALAVVSDGMGSRPCADKGAKAAASAVCDAWLSWRQSPLASVEDLLGRVEAAWLRRLKAVPPDDAAATCLFFAEDDQGRAVTAQIGDGIIVRRGSNRSVTAHPSLHLGFGMTHALGIPHDLGHWTYLQAGPLEPGEAILLATDGVADDLQEGRIGDLIDWVIAEFSPRRFPGRALAKELRNWPVPRHQDDKTLLILWKQ